MKARHFFMCCLVMLLGHALIFSRVAIGALTEEEESQRLYAAGLDHFLKARYDDALARFKEAAAKNPPYYLAVYYLGVTYGKCAEKEGGCQEKADYYGQAIDLFKTTLTLIEKKVTTSCKPPNPCEVIERVPGFAETHRDLGVAYYHKGDYQSAVTHLDKAEQISPLDAENDRVRRYKALSLYQLGTRYAKDDQLKEAQQAFKQVGTLSSDAELVARAASAGKDIAEKQKRQKNWEVRFATSADFDSNVLLASDGGPAFGQISHKGDYRFTVSAGVSLGFDIKKFLTRVTGSYDFYQSVYTDLSDFELQGHLFKVNIMSTPTPSLLLGIEGGTNFFRFGRKNYLHELYVMPYVGYFWGPAGDKRWGYTEASYRATNENYLISFFDPARDGLLQQVAIRQYFLGDGEKFSRYAFVGYQYNDENPNLKVGNDFQYRGHQAELGGVFTTPYTDTRLELSYLFRNNDYTFPNSRAAFLKERDDEMHSVIFTARQPLFTFFDRPKNELTRLDFKVSYIGTLNRSNIGIFQYHRHVGSVGFEVAF